MVIISEDSKCECVDNELLYADIKWCLFSQNTPAQLLDAVTDLAQAQHKNICVPSTTEAVLEIHSMQKSLHSSALQTCDSRAGAMHSPLPFPGVLCPFPALSMGGLSRMCPMLSCTAPLCPPRHGGWPWARQTGRGTASSCPEQGWCPCISQCWKSAPAPAEKDPKKEKDEVLLCLGWHCQAAVQYRQSWGSGLGAGLCWDPATHHRSWLNCHCLSDGEHGWIFYVVFIWSQGKGSVVLSFGLLHTSPRITVSPAILHENVFLLSRAFRSGWQSRSFAAPWWKRRSRGGWQQQRCCCCTLDCPCKLPPPTPLHSWDSSEVWGQPGNTKSTSSSSQKHTTASFYFPLSVISLCLERLGQEQVEVVNEDLTKGCAAGCEVLS